MKKDLVNVHIDVGFPIGMFVFNGYYFVQLPANRCLKIWNAVLHPGCQIFRTFWEINTSIFYEIHFCENYCYNNTASEMMMSFELDASPSESPSKMISVIAYYY